MKMAKVTAKYQITIPPKVREKLGIVPGAEVDIAKEGE
jgi:AbrB family looped-hinge helix DNA binding protein